MTLRLRYAAKSDVGLLREGNEDSAYAGPRLLAVADGMGGHAHGEVASAGAIATLAPLDGELPHEDMSAALEQAVHQANDELRRMVESDPSLEGMGTTLTAILWQEDRSAIVHIGDSRAYLLREGRLHRITRDHTLVQSLIDEGRIDEDEAAVHPQRSLLLRALDGRTEVEPDLAALDTRVGDRYLLCSDGLSGVVSEDTLRETLSAGWDPERVVQQLIELANRGGGPDNITCVVADVVEATDDVVVPSVVAGAAAHTVDNTEDTLSMDTSAGRAAALMRPGDADEEYAGEAANRPRRRRWPYLFLALVVVVVAVGGASYSAWSYVRSQFYVGARDGEVVIYRGISQHVAGRRLSQIHARTGLAVAELPTIQRSAVVNNIQTDSLNGAHQVVHRLRAAARACAEEARAPQRMPASESRSPKEEPSDKRRDTRRAGQGGSRTPSERPAAADSPSPSQTESPTPDGCPGEVDTSDG